MALELDRLAQRSQLLLANGHSWMPTQAMFAFAGSGMDDQTMVHVANTVREATVNGNAAAGIPAHDGYSLFDRDPVLVRRATPALGFKRYATGAIGPWPIEEADLVATQRNLQAQGFGTELEANGVWDRSWAAAHNQQIQKLTESQLAGDQGGGALDKISTTAGHALHILGAVMPKAAAHAAIGFVKSMPGDFRQVGADLASGAGGVAGGLAELAGVDNADRRWSATVGGFVEGQTPEEYMRQVEGDPNASNWSHAGHRVGRVLDDVGTLLLLNSAMKAGGALQHAAGEELAARTLTKEGGYNVARENLTYEAAARGPGVITRTINRGFGINTAETARIGARAAERRGLSSTFSRAALNNPTLANTGPWAERLADAEGWYYRQRTLVASPYRHAAVRLAGQAVSDVGVLGAKIRGTAAVAGTLNPESNLASHVQGEHTLDAVDDALAHMRITVLGQDIKPSIDGLAFMLHAPTGATAPSKRLTESGTAIREGGMNFMGRANLHQQISDGVGMSTKKIIRKFGGVDNYMKFMTNKIADYSARFWADEQTSKFGYWEAKAEEMGMESLGLKQQERILRDLSSEARNNPELLGGAMEKMLAQQHGNYGQLALRIKKDMATARITGKEFVSNGKAFLEASNIMSETVLPHVVPGAFAESGLIADMTNAAHFGLARTDSLMKQEGKAAVQGFRNRYADMQSRIKESTAAGRSGLPERIATAHENAVPFEEMQGFEGELRDFLFREFNVDDLQMPHSVSDKLSAADDWVNDLASEVYLPEGVDPRLAAAVGKINELGYKVVSGKDIGWLHVPQRPLDFAEGGTNWFGKAANHLGFNPGTYANTTIAQEKRLNVRNALADVTDARKVKLPPHYTADTLLRHLERARVVDPEPGRIEGAVMGLLKQPSRKLVDALERSEGLSHEEAILRAKDEVTRAFEIRDIPHKRFIRSLTDFEIFKKISPEQAEILGQAPFTRQDAEVIYNAVRKGYAKTPTSMIGFTKLEDLFRASLGFVGQGAVKRSAAGAIVGGAAGLASGVAGADSLEDILKDTAQGATVGTLAALVGRDPLGYAIANLPNRLVQLRNGLRFSLSPYFSFRRIAKTNVKLLAEGVTPSLFPMRAMESAGTLQKDQAYLRTLHPERYSKYTDDADRYLQANDIFGFYNHRMHEARAAGEWKRMGKSDEEIKNLLVKVFSYGSEGVQGRSALERSVNFVFFPFSFDKTLYRNIGGYMLDHPAQRVLIDRSLAAYHHFNETHNQGDTFGSSSFFRKHVPALEEAARLNAFTHGISAGQFGGINRPLLNLFLPQSWAPSSSSYRTLQQFVPAVKDFGRIYNESFQQGTILQATFENMYRHFRGPANTFGHPNKSTLTGEAQREEAFAMQTTWFDAYADIISYNQKVSRRISAGTATEENYLGFPMSSEWGGYAGEPVTKKNVNKIIHEKYPLYSVDKAVNRAVKNNDALDSYLAKTKGTALGDYVKDFKDAAENIGSQLDNDNVDIEKSKEATAQLRRAAIYVAERDGEFRDIYKHSFQKFFGPLEAVR